MNKKKASRNYYMEIDKALQSYEKLMSYHDKSIEWITDRIDWCWKFRHITEIQMEDLCKRACYILDNIIF